MTHNRFPPHDPREWLNRFSQQPGGAQEVGVDVLLEDLCFDAQPSAEKAIKAVFIHRGEKFPYVHELDKLFDQLVKNGLKIPKYIRAADDLSQFAVATRYPGMTGPIGKRTYRRAVRLASAVLRWAERQIGVGGKKPSTP